MPVQVIRSFERGVKLTLGKNPVLMNPGLRFKIPLIQEIFTTPVMPDTMAPKAVHVTTKDGISIIVQTAIEYEIEDAMKWLIEVTDATTNLHDLVRGFVADYITDINWSDVVKKSTRTEIKNKLNRKCQAEMGCKITTLMFADISQIRIILTSI